MESRSADAASDTGAARIGVVEGVVLALIVERARLGPRLHDQIMGLVKPLVRIDRIDAGGMIFGADAAHEAGDDPAIRNIVEHRVFFGDIQRIVHQRQGAAEDRDFHVAVAGAINQNGRDEIGRRHHPVSGLMMLVDADAVEAALAGIDQLLDIFAIKRRPALGVVERIWEIYPIQFVLTRGLEIEVAIRHQVKGKELHH